MSELALTKMKKENSFTGLYYGQVILVRSEEELSKNSSQDIMRTLLYFPAHKIQFPINNDLNKLFLENKLAIKSHQL
jgi:hypothetical protein